MAFREYRRRIRGAAWHFEQECSRWPLGTYPAQSGYEARARKPTTGTLCNECQAKARRRRAEK